MIRYLRLLYLLLFLPSIALAQGSGQLQPDQVLGNTGAGKAPATGVSMTSIIDKAFCQTQNAMLVRGVSNWACLTPSNNSVLVTNGSGVQSFSTTLPTNLALATPASVTLTNGTGLPLSTGIIGFGTGVATALGVAVGSAGGVPTIIAKGTAALGTSAISSGACATVVTSSATGAATTDVIDASFNADPSAIIGYTAPNMLTILIYPTVNNANFKVCNNTGSSITPGAVTLNWAIRR